jgi:AcrR family transcriptional regulator
MSEPFALSSEERLCAVLQDGTDELLGRVALAYGAHDAWAERLRAAAYEIVAFLREDSARARTMTVDVLSAGRRAQEIRDAGMRALTELIDQGREGLADPDSISRATAEGIVGAIYNRIHVEIAAGRCARLESMVPDLMYSAVLPYLGTEAAMAELNVAPPPPYGDARRN